MRIDIITLFDEMCESVLSESIIGRARKKGAIDIRCHQLRDFAFDKHRRVDDTTYGGGMGMLMMAEPIALCFEHITEELGEKPHFIYMSPKGKTLAQKKLKELCYYNGQCSGTYLKGTANAVKAFQKANNIYPTGVATVKTLEKLYEQELATPTPAPTAEMTPEPIPTPQ